MKMSCSTLRILTGLFWSLNLCAAEPLQKLAWSVDGVTREALVHIPKKSETNGSPVIFAFHGHGGSRQKAARMFGFHTIWPEAIVVYMQGLKTPARLTDPEGKRTGWQAKLTEQNDRDLKFFDAVLARLQKECKVDGK